MLLVFALSFIFLHARTSLAQGDEPQAIAVMFPTSTAMDTPVTGTVQLIQQRSQQLASVIADLANLGAGTTHGMHIHSFGDVSDTATALKTGPHFDPLNKALHGCPRPDEWTHGFAAARFHAGDVGNVTGNAMGAARVVFGAGRVGVNLIPGDILSAIGLSVIVHAAADDCVTQPTGNSGARRSQGVIGWRLNSFIPTLSPTPVAATTPRAATVFLVPSQPGDPSGTIALTQRSPIDPVNATLMLTNAPPRVEIRFHRYGDLQNGLGGFLHNGIPCGPQNGGATVRVEGVAVTGPGQSVAIDPRIVTLYAGSPVWIIGRGVAVYGVDEGCRRQRARGVVGVQTIT